MKSVIKQTMRERWQNEEERTGRFLLYSKENMRKTWRTREEETIISRFIIGHTGLHCCHGVILFGRTMTP